MQYQVLARKWRPQSFSDLVGQEHVSRTLLNALQAGRVAHAFLFSGPRGSGKTTTARILAKALNCHAGKPGEPCGTCVSCLEVTAGNSIDVLEIDAASNTGVDNIRNVIEEVRYRPARDRNKIYIIDEVHMLSTAAFNALLKTLEEPPSHVTFIMATTEYHKIPATILSRCQQYTFKLIRYPLILERLRKIAEIEKISISVHGLEQIAFSSGGSMRDAMSALDQVIAFSGNEVRDEDVHLLLGLVEPAVLNDVVQAIANNDAQKILQVVAELAEAGQDFQNFCRRLLSHFRNLMVVKAGVTDLALLGVPESLLSGLRAQAELFSREDLLRLFDALLKVESELKYATQVRFQLEVGLLEIAHLPQLRPLEELLAELRAGTPPQYIPDNVRTDRSLEQKAKTSSSGETRNQPGPKSDFGQTKERARQAAPELSSYAAAPTIAKPPVPAPGARELLEQIAAAVSKESLGSVLHSFQGAHLEGDLIVLDSGSVNEFYKRQINENLALIIQAASAVIGRSVKVRLGEDGLDAVKPPEPVSPASEPQANLMERVKREPVVQSFLDVFPGPVKAEKLDQ